MRTAKNSTKPTEITLKGQKFKIKYVTEGTIREKADGDKESGYYGCASALDRTLYIERTLSGAILRHTVFHEILHAYIEMSGLNEFLKEKVEEALIINFETLVEDLFLNDKFMDFMKDS